MKLEILLSVINLKKQELDKMNITGDCTVINQCNEKSFEKYKNFNIYSYNEKGLSNSRNRGLENVNGDIIILCDDDVVYYKDYEKIVLEEFRNNKKADIIFFNFENPNREKRIIKKRKRLYFYNSLNYASYNIAFRRKSIKNIKFNTMFGAGAKYNNGEDSLFIVNCLKNKLKIYSSPEYLGIVYNNTSTWFKGYDEYYFFSKGALFTAISTLFRHFLMLQYLLRHRKVLKNYKLLEAYRIMLKGSNSYLKEDVCGINYNSNKRI